MNHVYPIEQVFAELALRDHLGQVAVRGRDHAHVDVSVDPVGSHLLHFARFEEAEEEALHPGRHLPDLVEEDRALVGGFELAWPVPMGAGEASPHISEKLGLEQRFRQSGAIDRNERAIAAGALPVYLARDKLFAGPAFTGNKDFRVGIRHPGDFFLQFGQRGAVPDQGRWRVVPHRFMTHSPVTLARRVLPVPTKSQVVELHASKVQRSRHTADGQGRNL